jgi:HAD superfamily hydrolase (TIGR01549 family)
VKTGAHHAARFAAVIFDMDGTLTRPAIDFDGMRRELGIPRGDIVAEILTRSPVGQQQAWAIIEAHEEKARRDQELQPGCLRMLARCRTAGLRTGLVTRNSSRSVAHFCATHGVAFDGVVSREFPHVKPHPAPVLHLLKQWDVAAPAALMVGDYIHDIESGRAAGTRTCFFQNPGLTFHGERADYVAHSMPELEAVIFGCAG